MLYSQHDVETFVKKNGMRGRRIEIVEDKYRLNTLENNKFEITEELKNNKT